MKLIQDTLEKHKDNRVEAVLGGSVGKNLEKEYD